MGSDSLDIQLRPRRISEIIGQTDVKSTLNVFIDSARRRLVTLDHVLLSGPAGLGKTTIGGTIAAEMEQKFIVMHGPQVDAPAVWKLTRRELIDEYARYVIFIDEIHAVEKQVFTMLLPLMEEFQFGGERVNPFTMIGATTLASKLPKPLRDRFGISYQLDYYPTDELTEIIMRSFNLLVPDTLCDPRAIESLAARSRGTPRVANRLLRRTLDFHWTGDMSAGFTLATVTKAMKALGIDISGLEPSDRRILRAMFERFPNRPAGINAISAAVGEDAVNLETVVEPWLVREGFINRERGGRVLTSKGLAVAALEIEGATSF